LPGQQIHMGLFRSLKWRPALQSIKGQVSHPVT